MTTTKRRSRIRRNEHGGPQLPLDPGDSTVHEAIRAPDDNLVISAVPQHGGNLLKGYVWIGNDRGCFGTMETRDLLAFVDAIRKQPNVG